MNLKDKLEREKYWRRKVAQWQESKLSLSQFAKTNQLHYKALSRWKIKFIGAEPSTNKKASTFKQNAAKVHELVPVHLLDTTKDCTNSSRLPVALELLLLNGRTLRFDKSCPLEFLSSLIPVAEASANV